MLKVGLVGEDPNDTKSIKLLLEKRYHKKIQFYSLAKKIKGYQLDTIKLKNVLRIEIPERKCKWVVYIRDLDAFKSQKKQFENKYNWFKKLNDDLYNNGIFLLNIWELEALIFADVETLNKVFNVSYRSGQNPMFIKEPKELLKKITADSANAYHESKSPVIFDQLSLNRVEENCHYFKLFIKDFENRLGITSLPR